MLAGIPLAFSLDACAVHKEVKWSCRSLVRYGDGQRLLMPTQGAEVWHRPVQPNPFQQALHKPGRLPQGQAKQNFEGQAGLNCCIATGLLTPPASRGFSFP
jgi:hypothetical protein